MAARDPSCRTLAACLLGLVASAAAADEYAWEASSGRFPDQADCRFHLVNTSDPEQPELSGGVLTLGNDQDNEVMFYRMHDDGIRVPPVSEVTWRARYVSGGSSSPLTRTAMAIAVTTAPEVGMVVYIGDGEVFAVNGAGVRVAAASVATADAFHDYALVINGAGAGDPYSVYQDRVLLFEAELTVSASSFGRLPRVIFGELSVLAHGVSEWQRFGHNMAARFLADCDGSGSLDFFDFLCFQDLFAAGDPEADCDGSGSLDFFDFLCFQDLFAAGCP
jgi:hypothetical protein